MNQFKFFSLIAVSSFLFNFNVAANEEVQFVKKEEKKENWI